MNENRLEPDVRRNIRERLWDSVAEVSDLAFQEATWGKIDNPHFTYVEFAECYFDCVTEGVDDALEWGLVSKDEAEALRPLDEALIGYAAPNENPYDQKAILADAKWQAVVRTAENSRQRLRELLPADDAERLSHSNNRIEGENSPKGEK